VQLGLHIAHTSCWTGTAHSSRRADRQRVQTKPDKQTDGQTDRQTNGKTVG